MSIEPGTRLLHYRVVEKIGEGGMGVVWRAEDTKLRRDVALKLLPENLGCDSDRLARFEREARMLASLSHPNIAAIHGLEQDGDRRFLVLELVPGKALSERLSGGALGVEESLRVGCEIAKGLEAAHGQNVIHRDLKPANVQLSDKGDVKILDFGLAKTLAPVLSASQLEELKTATMITARQTVVGTTPYMSPEQAAGKPLDRRTDIWSFGCILYETLTGARAFSGDTVSSTLAAIHGAEPDWERLPLDTPVRVRELLRHCLTKDPERRLHDIADARIELEDAIAGRDAPDPATAHPSRWWIGAAIVALLLVVGIAGKAWLDRNAGGSPAYVEKSGVHTIAVLPFSDRSAEGDQEYLADGLAEEVIQRLARFPGTRVVGRQSSFSFRNRDVDLVSIGEALGVELIVDGSVHLQEDRLRVHVEVVNAADGFTLWNEDYDRTLTLTELFQIQEAIARSVVEAVGIELSVAEMEATEVAASTSDMEAYRLYLQGRRLFHLRELERAVELFREATDRDRDFAEAWAGMAAASYLQTGRGIIPSDQADEQRATAETALRHALELDPDLVEANAVRGLMLSWSKDWIGAERQYERTLRLSPNDPTSLFWLGAHQLGTGRLEEAGANLTRALALDPASGIINLWVGRYEMLRGNGNQAMERYRTAQTLAGGQAANGGIVGILIERGEYEEAFETFEPRPGASVEMLRQVVAAREDPALRPALARGLRGVHWQIQLSAAYVMQDVDLALSALDLMAADDRAPPGNFLGVWKPEMAPLRRDPRFVDWASRVGLVDAWNELGWPESCEPAGDGAVCH